MYNEKKGSVHLEKNFNLLSTLKITRPKGLLDPKSSF